VRVAAKKVKARANGDREIPERAHGVGGMLGFGGRAERGVDGRDVGDMVNPGLRGLAVLRCQPCPLQAGRWWWWWWQWGVGSRRIAK